MPGLIIILADNHRKYVNAKLTFACNSLLNAARRIRQGHVDEDRVRHFLKRMIGQAVDLPEPSVVACDVAPDAPFIAIGDIHGRLDLLEELLARHCVDQTLVFLGDYVDRGPSSAEVLALLKELCATRSAICLKGNHEQMMLDFIDDPLGRGAGWLLHGGGETLRSYGIAPPKRGGDLLAASANLEEALPPGQLDWLRALPLQWRSGNLCCVHAAMDPAKAPDRQRSRTLIWGHPQFLTTPRDDGIWVVHGHTVVKRPLAGASRIAVDTGAYQTNTLTAAEITPGSCRFVSV